MKDAQGTQKLLLAAREEKFHGEEVLELGFLIWKLSGKSEIVTVKIRSLCMSAIF